MVGKLVELEKRDGFYCKKEGKDKSGVKGKERSLCGLELTISGSWGQIKSGR